MKEADIQRAFVQWLRANGILHFAPCNENQWSGVIRQYVRPEYVAIKIISMINKKLETMGKRRGVHDVEVLTDSGYPLFIEFKMPGRKQRDDQKEWEEAVGMRGYRYYLCYSLDEAVKIVNSHRGQQ